MRRLTALVLSLVLASCASDAPPGPNDIWDQPSATVDPTHLPLGDAKYLDAQADPPQVGYVWSCRPQELYETLPPIGAQRVGEWIHDTSFDITAKPRIQGEVAWPEARFSLSLAGDQRRCEGNGLPVGVPTGLFPVAATDPAFSYDPNPCSITAQPISFAVPASPVVAEQPSCVELYIGITLDGVALVTGLDSSGRDELAYELMDGCMGQAQPGGLYHRHVLSPCLPQVSERQTLVGYALDGFGLFSPFDADGTELTSQDLDECHGRTAPIPWEGRRVSMYHYVLTRDFPYTVSCFRGSPTRPAFPALPPPSAVAATGGCP